LREKRNHAPIEGAEVFVEKFFLECVGLDIWRLERELKGTLGEEKEVVVESLKKLALEGKGSEIVRRFMEGRTTARTVEGRKKVVEVTIHVRCNLDWIANISKGNGYGWGPVEKTADIAAARRFKRHGMSWYRRNANPLLELRLLKLNEE
jgi:hypothetical protein